MLIEEAKSLFFTCHLIIITGCWRREAFQPLLPVLKFSLGWAGVWWVKLSPRKESLFNKSQNQWPATARYRILSEKCVVLLSASRHWARDVSLSSTLDFVSAAATSPPPALPGIKLRFSSARSAARWFIALAGPGPSVRNTVSVWSLNLILRVLLITLEVCLCKD